MTEEQLLLNKLAEECLEVAHQCMKAVRFGLDDFNPKTGEVNRASIQSELFDVVATVRLLEDRAGEYFDLDPNKQEFHERKAKYLKYLGVSKNLGRVS